eukprot:COSAG01_NODE_1195_length_11304_cov_118.555823_11_plen_125_part_00
MLYAASSTIASRHIWQAHVYIASSLTFPWRCVTTSLYLPRLARGGQTNIRRWTKQRHTGPTSRSSATCNHCKVYGLVQEGAIKELQERIQRSMADQLVTTGINWQIPSNEETASHTFGDDNPDA